MKEFFMQNWMVIVPLLLPLGWWIVRQTPTEKDDKIWKFIVKIINVILADNKKNGGRHNG